MVEVEPHGHAVEAERVDSRAHVVCFDLFQLLVAHEGREVGFHDCTVSIRAPFLVTVEQSGKALGSRFDRRRQLYTLTCFSLDGVDIHSVVHARLFCCCFH